MRSCHVFAVVAGRLLCDARRLYLQNKSSEYVDDLSSWFANPCHRSRLESF